MIVDRINKLSKRWFCCYFIMLFIFTHVIVVKSLPGGTLYSLDFSSAFASVIIAYFLSWVFKRKGLKYYDPIVLYVVSALCTVIYRSVFYYDQFGNIKLIGISWLILSFYFLISGINCDKENA